MLFYNQVLAFVPDYSMAGMRLCRGGTLFWSCCKPSLDDQDVSDAGCSEAAGVGFSKPCDADSIPLEAHDLTLHPTKAQLILMTQLQILCSSAGPVRSPDLLTNVP